MAFVWAFIPNGMDAPSAIFDSYDKAVAYITGDGFVGTLYKYPLNQSIYQLWLSRNDGKQVRPFYESLEFKQNASPGHLDHEHFGEP